MANVNITGIQIGDNTYYPRRVYEAASALNPVTGKRGFNIRDCRPIDGLSIIIRFQDLIPDETDNYNGIKYVWTDLGLIPIKYMNINQPYLYFNEHDMAEFVFRGSGDSSVCELVSYPHNMIPISYNKLKDERDNGRLIPGMKYRITDYVTQCYYTATSSEHPFDIVVTAIDNSTLDENARAMLHDGDEYFANCDLSKWEIKYTLDADPNRFEWAKSGTEISSRTSYMMEYSPIAVYNSTNGYVLDNNDVEYFIIPDSLFVFDGDSYYATNHPNMFVKQDELTTGNYIYSLEYSWDICSIINPNIVSWIDNQGYKYLCIDERNRYFISANPTDRNIYEIYDYDSMSYEIIHIFRDAEGNDDFIIDISGNTLVGSKNMMFEHNGNQYYKLKDINNNYAYLVRSDNLVVGGDVLDVYVDMYDVNNGFEINNSPEITKGIIYHMKDEWGNEAPYDFKNIMFKINGFELATNNRYYYTFTSVIQNDMSKTGKYLDNIIKPNFSYAGFDKCQVLNNIILSCNPISLSLIVSDNIFDYNCYNMFIGSIYNDVNLDLHNNTFGKGCYRNNMVVSHIGLIDFYNNTFGNGCYNNTLGENFHGNKFGRNCYNNTFGRNCYNNTFGDDCCINKLRSKCYINNFGNLFVGNILGDLSSYNTFGNGCSSNRLGESSDNNTFGNCCVGNIFGDYFQNNVLMNSVRHCFIKDDKSLQADNRPYCYYNTFNTGVQHVTLFASGSLSSSYVTKNIVVHSDLNSTSTKFIRVATNKETLTNVYYKTPTEHTM